MADDREGCFSRESAERLVDAQQSIIDCIMNLDMPPGVIVVALLLVATSLTKSAGRSHRSLVELLWNMANMRDKGTPYISDEEVPQMPLRR